MHGNRRLRVNHRTSLPSCRRRIHQLKYFTWVEQQGRTYKEIQAQWYERDYWTAFQKQIPEMDALIEEFNAKVGLL